MAKNAKPKRSPTLVDLSPAEVRALGPIRDGFEELVDPLVSLYRDNLDTMRIPGFDPSSIATELAAADVLAARETELQAELALVQKTQRMHRSNAYHGFLRLYDRARSAANASPAIRRVTAHVEAFMKRAKKKEAAPPTTGTIASATGT